MAEAKGEIIVFTDARQTIASDALKNLVANFGDSSVGCVSGELIIGPDPNIASSRGIGLYWRLEKKIRYWEGLAGSTVGATGAFYAVRRNLLVSLPQETILDDVYIPFQVVRQGRRVVPVIHLENAAALLIHLQTAHVRHFSGASSAVISIKAVRHKNNAIF